MKIAVPAPDVLIIDDSAEVRQLLVQALNDIGVFEIEEACNGADGLSAAALEQPDLILLDQVMSAQTGEDILPSLRELLPNALIFMVSSIKERSFILKMKNLGANNYILKTDSDFPIIVQRKIMKAWGQSDVRTDRFSSGEGHGTTIIPFG